MTTAAIPTRPDAGDYDDLAGVAGSWDFASSWHGTHVAGIIAASTNNGEGIAGVAPNARIRAGAGAGRVVAALR